MLHKYRLWVGGSLFVFFAFVLSACGPAGNQSQGLTPPAASPTDTPVAAPAQQEYTNSDFGYSLSYPSGYEVQSSFSHTVVFLAPQGTPGHRERALLTVERTLDQNAEWYANQAKQENANLGIEITSSVELIDDQQAYILGRLPGQDLNRQVFIVYKGILYHLRFMPDNPQEGENYQQMETLYTAIVNSLRFLPERRDVPPVTYMNNMIHQLEQVLESRSQDEIVGLLGDEFYLGYWMPDTPERVPYERLGRNAVAPLILGRYLSQVPALALEEHVDWASVAGSPDPVSAFFPDEVVRPVLVKGWGPSGADEAVLIIGQRSDGSLFWRGAFVAQGVFAP